MEFVAGGGFFFFLPGSMTVLILQHPFQRDLRAYLIQLLAEEWERLGIRVLFHCGTKNCPDADVLILHVNLSVVPEEYLKGAERYPVAINGGISNIRKTSYSRIRVLPGDGYEGEEIIKSAYNYAGIPERKARAAEPGSHWDAVRGKFSEWMRKVGRRNGGRPVIKDKSDYCVLPRREMVPDEWLAAEEIIVEQFRPERRGEKYVLREWYFFGDCEWMGCEVSADPIITSGELTPELERPVPPEIRLRRKELGVDYGKIDFGFDAEDGPVLYDVNKTTGVWLWESPRLPGMVEALAPGLFSYVPAGDFSASSLNSPLPHSLDPKLIPGR